MSRILLVAAREFRQIAATRSFWLTLLILPLAFAIGPLASRFMDRSETTRVMLIDRTGGQTAQAIARRLKLDDDRRVLVALSRYVDRHHLEAADPGATWARHDRWYTDEEVARFAATGGVSGALAAIRRIKPAEVPDFVAPEPDYALVPVPPAIAAAPAARLDALLRPLLRPDGKAEPLDYALLVPAEFGRAPLVRLWSNGQPSADFVQPVQQVLGRELQSRYLAASGVAPATARAAAMLTPAIAVQTPTRDSVRQRTLIRSILPLASAYILLMSLILSGSWMLQGSVEERSNKLIEAMLACVSPDELMYGKLVGTVAIGLSMVATWAACGLFAAYATHGAIADMIRPALEPVSSVGAIATILYFFVLGYVMVAMIFLAIGATAESMRDAQGYLTPVLLIIMVPVTVLVQAVLRGSEGVGVQVLTWIPIYTPFAILARLGTGVPTWQVLGAGALLAAFVALEMVALGRVFRASLLASGGRPSLSALSRMMRRPA
ncbi:ABC transporter permease [Sphingomonas rubra]|uniref:ABC-2 type transport system permease protein n=1 Tax=Sphingomonas rubra TaxID=634430 RepID=A0A1I5THD6_9SPHN|nr:ABC transporter permease [Sphingomonas rubra]SFP82453.1 ABC-2 type transport system permease protein [Sphingomonas rubra]